MGRLGGRIWIPQSLPNIDGSTILKLLNELAQTLHVTPLAPPPPQRPFLGGIRHGSPRRVGIRLHPCPSHRISTWCGPKRCGTVWVERALERAPVHPQAWYSTPLAPTPGPPSQEAVGALQGRRRHPLGAASSVGRWQLAGTLVRRRKPAKYHWSVEKCDSSWFLGGECFIGFELVGHSAKMTPQWGQWTNPGGNRNSSP